jgi:predicted DNA-binding protein with PD1-like motif
MFRTVRVAFVNFAVFSILFFFASPAATAQNQRQLPPLPAGYVRPPMNVLPGHAPKMRVEELPAADSHTYKISLSTGDEILSGLTQFAEQHHIVSAHITGIGGLISAKLGWGSDKIPGMKEIDVTQKCELVSLTGNISERGGHPYVHLHGVVAFSDGSTKGGHVIEAHVDPLAEIFVVTTGAPEPAANGGTRQ